MSKLCVSAMALATLAGVANAQVAAVEFRLVERRGQAVVPNPAVGSNNATDNVLDIAVQARVTGLDGGGRPFALGGFNFDAVIMGEADAGTGTLAREKIMLADRTYDNGAGISSYAAGNTLRQHGMAAQYCYLAGINPSFNGVINTSSGTFTNTPGNQEIGLITGGSASGDLLATPNMDQQDGDTGPNAVGGPDGNPDTWNATHPWNSDNDPMPAPANGDTAALDPAIGTTYFAMGQFIDIYHFKYTITNLTPDRVLQFRLNNLGAQTFVNILFNNGLWGANNSTALAGQIISTGLDIPIIPAPGSAALLGLGALIAVRRRRS